MSQRFEDLKVSREGRYSLGRDLETGTKYLSIPVANRMSDYEEYYRISDDEYERFAQEEAAVREFADACRRREEDERIILKPGTDRGTAL